MIITGISTTELRDVVRKLNATDYANNIVVENAEALSSTGTRINVKLGTADSRKHGSRQASSGRHGKWLCWHGFRDVFRAVMDVNPDAVVRSRDAIYRGKQGFENTYPSTAERNVGSMVQPAYAPDLCVGACRGDWD